jgi:xylulokinase
VRPRGAFLGLARGSDAATLYRAVLEGLALQSRLMLDGIADLAGVAPPGTVRVIGGATRNPLFMAIKAAALARPLHVVDEPEATALGAALCAGVAAGVHPSFAAATAALDRRETVIAPDPALAETYARILPDFAALPARLRSAAGH